MSPFWTVPSPATAMETGPEQPNSVVVFLWTPLLENFVAVGIGQNDTDKRPDLVFRGLLNVVYDDHSDVVLLRLHFEAEFPNGIQGTHVAGVG